MNETFRQENNTEAVKAVFYIFINTATWKALDLVNRIHFIQYGNLCCKMGLFGIVLYFLQFEKHVSVDEDDAH